MPAPVANLVCSKYIVVIALYLVVYVFWCVLQSGRCFSSSSSLREHFLGYFFPITESQKRYEKY